MDNETKQQLNDILERLQDVQQYAPAKTTYTMGKTESSVSIRLLDIIRDLKVMLNDTTNEPAGTTEPASKPVTVGTTAKSGK